MATATRPTLPIGLIALAGLAGVGLGYTLAVDPVVTSLRQVVYPLVWIATSAAALRAVRGRLGTLHPTALAVGTGYALALLWTAGLLGPAGGLEGVSVHLGFPGWGPAVVYGGPVVQFTFVPFLAVGYATLGLLAAAAVQSTLRTTVAGVFGLFACVSCTAPLFAGLAGSLGAGSAAATLSQAGYELATAAFLVSAGALAVLARRGPDP